ncbi:MAG: IPExxxVDY family protein [Sphingobacteriales bacterium]|nr:IPExxxVDY family protein [Sphingobacteriales bacterium]
MKLKISNDDLADAFFEDSHVLGVVSSLKNYQFIWHINQQLGFTFRLNSELEIELRKKTRNYFFSIYEYQIPQTSLVYYIYHNQNNGEYLLPEFKHLDFIWMIKGEDFSLNELDALQKTIKLMPSVQFVVEMDQEKIKNKQHLIF